MPPRSHKLLGWLFLSMLSAVFAEVISFSSPFVFFDPWGLLVVLPLYGLHMLVLAWLVFRAPRVTLPLLVVAGMLFGMYEAYLTKVLWDPTWLKAELPWQAGGIYLAQTAILVLFWHPLMAFIVPLAAGEWLMCHSSEVIDCLPDWIRRSGMAGLLAFAAYCGLYHVVNAPDPLVSLLSAGSAMLVLLGMRWLWRSLIGTRSYSLRSLVPSNHEARWLIVLLALGYVGMGAFARVEALPQQPTGHITVLALYALLVGLLWLAFGQASALPPAQFPSQPAAWHALIVLSLVFTLVAVLAHVVKPLALLVGVFSWVAGSLFSVIVQVRLLASSRM